MSRQLTVKNDDQNGGDIKTKNHLSHLKAYLAWTGALSHSKGNAKLQMVKSMSLFTIVLVSFPIIFNSSDATLDFSQSNVACSNSCTPQILKMLL